jgi:hypothetical protein
MQGQSASVNVFLDCENSPVEATLYFIDGDKAVLRSSVHLEKGSSAILRRSLLRNGSELPVEVGDLVERVGEDQIVEIRLRALGSVANQIWQAFCYAA